MNKKDKKKYKEILKTVDAWHDNTCPYIEKCKKEGKYEINKCPKKCLEDDYDYMENIYCIIYPNKKEFFMKLYNKIRYWRV